MRVIAAGALTLEPQLAAHAAEMFTVLGDPAIYEYENAPPVSLEWLRERYSKLETRRSADGQERWLNWVIRHQGGPLIGFVQATLHADGQAAIAYELASAYWGRGLASQAVQAMISELVEQHGVSQLNAVLKQRNLRSRRLLERLGFAPAEPDIVARYDLERDELLMRRRLEGD